MAESAFLCSWKSTIGRRTNRGWDGWSRKKAGRYPAELFSEGHTSRGELRNRDWGWTSWADLQFTKLTPFNGEQAEREARVDMRKQPQSSRHRGDHPGMVTMVMQKGGWGAVPVPKPKQESGQQVTRKKFSFWLENWVENGVFQRHKRTRMNGEETRLTSFNWRLQPDWISS